MSVTYEQHYNYLWYDENGEYKQGATVVAANAPANSVYKITKYDYASGAQVELYNVTYTYQVEQYEKAEKITKTYSDYVGNGDRRNTYIEYTLAYNTDGSLGRFAKERGTVGS